MTMVESELLMSTAELDAILGHKDLRVLDCRFDLMDTAAGRAAWIEGHIPGAVYADLDNDLAAPVTDASGRHPLPAVDMLAATFSTMGIDANTSVVVYDDRNGAVAARAWWLLRWLGHKRVRLLDGGYAAWHVAGGKIEQGKRSVTARQFVARPQEHMVLECQEIETTTGNLHLVDARDAARYRGEVEPIDAVAGHIPGALNLPFADTVLPDGRWKSAAEIRELLSPLLANGADTNWSVMCGSGVTACHLVVSGLLAGYREPRLYVGSWSEWIRDPGRPVAQGG